MNLLGRAIAIAAEAHQRQTDRGGNPYILHPIRMMMRLRTTDHELMSIAIMHDVIEDTPWTFARLQAEGFSDRVIDALRVLTKMSPDEDYDNFIDRVLTNKDAMLVKLEDLRDNSDITRLKGLRDKDLLRTRKYHAAYIRISEKLAELANHKDTVDEDR